MKIKCYAHYKEKLDKHRKDMKVPYRLAIEIMKACSKRAYTEGYEVGETSSRKEERNKWHKWMADKMVEDSRVMLGDKK